MNTSTTTPLNGDVKTYLKALHLPTVRECFQEYAQAAQRESLSYEQYLLSVVERECEVRRMNRINRLLRESRLPLEKSLAQFERSRLPRSINTQIASLVEGTFLDRCENVLAFGNPSGGKTHLLCAIAQELVLRHALTSNIFWLSRTEWKGVLSVTLLVGLEGITPCARQLCVDVEIEGSYAWSAEALGHLRGMEISRLRL